MQIPQVTPEELKDAGHVLIACVSALGAIFMTAIGVLIRTAYKLGRDAQKFAEGLETLRDVKKATEAIPVMQQQIGTLEEAWTATRSDIKHLLRGSRPDYNGSGGDTQPPPAPGGQ